MKNVPLLFLLFLASFSYAQSNATLAAAPAPRVAFYSPNQQWEVENHGVDPDIEIDFDPHAWRQGNDPQLERAVAVAMNELKTISRPM